eukprot:m.110379 g.110379  ORF g.110379 m.110379 type:complete len:87 (-) comp13400_c0_seq1:215-475(-)
MHCFVSMSLRLHQLPQLKSSSMGSLLATQQRTTTINTKIKTVVNVNNSKFMRTRKQHEVYTQCTTNMTMEVFSSCMLYDVCVSGWR